MKKIILLILIIFTVLPITVNAQTNEETIIKEGISLSGINELLPLLPENAEEFFKDGFDEKTTEKISIESIAVYIKNIIKEKIFSPLKLFLSMTGIIIISAVISSMREGSGNKDLIFSSVVSLAISTLLASFVTECITKISASIRDMSYFVLSFIPVFSGVTLASGKPMTSMVYQATLFGTIQLFSQIFVNVVIPILGIFLAISIIGSSFGIFKTDGFSKALKTTATWLLTFCMTVFVGMLTIKGLVSTTADTVTTRTTKFLLSTFIPVVGGALSEAYNSLSACMGVVKSTVGVFGIIAVVVCYLPILLEVLLTILSVYLSSVVGGIFEQKNEVALLKSVSSILSVMLGIVLCFGLMIIVSVTIMLIIGNGG